MYNIICFQEKNIKKYVCLLYLEFQTCYPKHTHFFIWPYVNSFPNIYRILVEKRKRKVFKISEHLPYPVYNKQHPIDGNLNALNNWRKWIKNH